MSLKSCSSPFCLGQKLHTVDAAEKAANRSKPRKILVVHFWRGFEGTLIRDLSVLKRNVPKMRLRTVRICRKRAEYGFAEHGFKHRAQ